MLSAGVSVGFLAALLCSNAAFVDLGHGSDLSPGPAHGFGCQVFSSMRLLARSDCLDLGWGPDRHHA